MWTAGHKDHTDYSIIHFIYIYMSVCPKLSSTNAAALITLRIFFLLSFLVLLPLAFIIENCRKYIKQMFKAVLVFQESSPFFA